MNLGFRSVFMFDFERRQPFESICAAVQPFSAKLHLWKATDSEIIGQYPLRKLWKNSSDDHLTGNSEWTRAFHITAAPSALMQCR